MTERMERVDDKPEPTVENIPDKILQGVISMAVSYGKCPACGKEQFYSRRPGYNSYHYCVRCDEEIRT